MYLYILKLKEILNNPSMLDLRADFLPLNSSKKPPLLIYGRSLGEAVLKSKDFIPSNLIEYFKAINNIPNKKFPFIEQYFEDAPLFLNGLDQIEARESLLTLYKKIEEDLSKWLPVFTKEFLSEVKNKSINNPIKIAENFTNEVFKRMVLTALDCNERFLIEFPDGILNLYRSEINLDEYESRLNLFFTFIEHQLSSINESPKDAWKIISIIVMGYEPILNALAFSMILNKDHKVKWNAERFLKEISPISFVVRISTKENYLSNLKIQAGQEVFVCLNLINNLDCQPNKISEKNSSFSFGMGKHMCPGRKVSLIIVETFINEWINFSDINFSPDKFISSRDLVLRLKENI